MAHNTKTREQKLRDLKRRQAIVKFDHPALKTVSTPIRPGDDLSFLQTMRQACKATGTGVGLAANQIGVTKRAVYIAPPGTPSYFMLNPEILSVSEETEEGREGCLSYPDVVATIARPKKIVVKYYRPEDPMLTTPVVVEVEGYEARIHLHELDHLNGVCLVGDVWKAQQGANTEA